MGSISFSLADLDIIPGATGEVRTTCPLCSHTRKKAKDPCLSVNLSKGIWHCNHCDEGGYIKGHQSFQRTNGFRADKFRAKQKEASRGADLRLKKANKIYILNVLNHSIKNHPILNSYLHYRGLNLKTQPTDLLLHPGLSYKYNQIEPGTHKHIWKELGKFPAMVGIIRTIDGKAKGIHQTYLQSEGVGKADVGDLTSKKIRNLYSRSTKGGAVRLYEPTNELAVCEGIETALAVYVSTGLPVWACLGTSGLKSVKIPDTVKTVYIMADHDKIDKKRGIRPGEEAARILAKRLINEGRKVKIVIPPGEGTDWLDVLNSTKVRKVA